MTNIEPTESDPTPELIGTTAAAPEQQAASLTTILQLILSLCAILSLWGLAFLLLLLGFFNQYALQSAGIGPNSRWGPNASFLLQAAGLIAVGALIIPSVVTTIQRLRNKPLADAYKPILNLNPFVPVLLLLPVYGIGYLVTKTSLGAASSLAAYVLPFLHILSVILPALFLVLIAARKLESGSPQRRSGVLAAGVALGPFVILLLETLALVAVIIIVSLYIANQPELYEQLMDLVGEITGIQGSMEDLLRLITPFLSSPVVILGTLTFISVIAPIIEELFKPVGVWILAKKSISPAEGFAAGAISGAGFAIFESLMLNAGVDDWLMGSVVRIGTSVIHIATTAMSGWALATAWRSGKYLRLVLVFLSVVSVHGLWNGLAVITIFHEFGAAEGIQDALPLMGTVAVLSPYILIGLTIAGFILLFLMNRHLRQTDSPETMLIKSN